ncbi:MAG: PspC domain-containing protein [Bacteroidetes bacterium]|nr:MAG: PspC domain-containing protein [Bacteroidota bacterium]
MAEIKNRKHPSPTETAFSSESSFAQPVKKELKRSTTDKKIFGVCGGIANYFGIDSTIVRIIYLVLVFASFGWGLLLYVILTLLMPEEKPTTTL